MLSSWRRWRNVRGEWGYYGRRPVLMLWCSQRMIVSGVLRSCVVGGCRPSGYYFSCACWELSRRISEESTLPFSCRLLVPVETRVQKSTTLHLLCSAFSSSSSPAIWCQQCPLYARTQQENVLPSVARHSGEPDCIRESALAKCTTKSSRK